MTKLSFSSARSHLHPALWNANFRSTAAEPKIPQREQLFMTVLLQPQNSIFLAAARFTMLQLSKASPPHLRFPQFFPQSELQRGNALRAKPREIPPKPNARQRKKQSCLRKGANTVRNLQGECRKQPKNRRSRKGAGRNDPRNERSRA